MSDERVSKQVIVIRKDLHMGRGKAISQGGHACLSAYKQANHQSQAFKDWESTGTTKICVCVNSEEELLDIYQKAKHLNVALIKDAGKTEFKEPTLTCLCIGPCYSDDVDKITGELKLL